MVTLPDAAAYGGKVGSLLKPGTQYEAQCIGEASLN